MTVPCLELHCLCRHTYKHNEEQMTGSSLDLDKPYTHKTVLSSIYVCSVTSTHSQLTRPCSSFHAVIRVIHCDGSVVQAGSAVQLAVVCVKLAVSPTNKFLVPPATALTDTLRHSATNLTLPSLTAVLHQAGICEQNSHIMTCISAMNRYQA